VLWPSGNRSVFMDVPVDAYVTIHETDDGVDAPPMEISSYRLHNPVPNPFNPKTTIMFDLPKRSSVSLEVFDVAGRLVRRLVKKETLPRGRHSVDWNGRDDRNAQVGSGVYFLRIQAGEFKSTGRVVLLK